ncbi:amidohydrolase family protein [Rhabdothermincola salaria]|uniref:amidohydrolase family protein n=1 Tax=Rhabdothermincola salaria TaxID=2903142 RepID=UPI001E3F7DE6|nr:amidohydrolase family protein [Rhabdothermincola salaria]MCD9622251.1 amidohydrolase family protein [Rhabdothermincola salaria]
MTMPEGLPIIDTMIGFPAKDMKAQYAFITQQTKDKESKEEFAFPAEYMFKKPPDKEKALQESDDPVAYTLGEMDKWGVAKGMVGVGGRGEEGAESTGEEAIERHPDRFFGAVNGDPNEGMAGIEKIVRAYETWGVKAITMFPAGCFPQVAINDKKMYPIYAKACELDIPVFVCTGIPGPRLKFQVQHVEHVDEVMYDFPELTYVSRHGCEPWTELMVKLMLKWPGLHYSTSAFAPKHYNQRIIDYANTRGADKVIYAGYFPMGLSLERIMTEMKNVPFKDEVWPKFLHQNAERVLKL